MTAKAKSWAVQAAEEIDAACSYGDPRPDRLIRIARLVAIIDKHRPRDIGQEELEAALKKLDALEQRTEAALREAEGLRAVSDALEERTEVALREVERRRAVYPHGV